MNFDEIIKNQSLSRSLLEKRIVTLFRGVDATLAKEVISDLLYLEAQDSSTPIYMYLNSPGGEVNSGFAIYDMMRFIKPDVKVICTGLCASIATIILLGAKKEDRNGLPNSRYLIHQPLIRGQIFGQASDIQIHAEEITKTRSKINSLLAQETGQVLDKVSKDTDRDYWMTASESLEYGLISKIVTEHNQI